MLNRLQYDIITIKMQYYIKVLFIVLFCCLFKHFDVENGVARYVNALAARC